MNSQFQKGSLEDYLTGKDISNKTFTFRYISNYNPSPTYTSADGRPVNRSATPRLEAFSVIKEKDSEGRMVRRTIRYIAGESSIYKDEQSSDKDIPKKKFYIEFPRGIKVVSGSDNLLLKYMMSDNLNASNPNRLTDVEPQYELVDTVKAIRQQMQKDEILDEVKLFCRKGDYEEVRAYARVLNQNVNLDSDEVRWNLLNVAIANPEKFIEGQKSPLLKKKHYIYEALDEGYLVHNPANNSIAWNNNPGAPLAVAPMGKRIEDVVETLARAFSTDAGRTVYEALIDMLRPVKVEPTLSIPTKEELDAVKAQAKPVASIYIAEESDEEIAAMVDEAIEKGFVIQKPPFWIEFRGNKFKKKEGFIDSLKGDKDMFKLFKIELQRSR